MQNEIKYFSMFTGVGGFEIGIERANGFEKLWVENRKKNPLQGQGDTSITSKSIQRQCAFNCVGNERANDNRPTRKKEQVLPSSTNSTNNSQGDSWESTFSCVGFSEIDKYANQVLKKRFPDIPNFGDCTKINPEELPDFDLLCGGVPCQSWSIAGKRKGFEDIRGTMWFEVFRIAKAKKPTYLLLENVKGLLSHDKGKSFEKLCEIMCEMGYVVDFTVLNSKYWGVPQNRERVFILAIRGDKLDKAKII